MCPPSSLQCFYLDKKTFCILSCKGRVARAKGKRGVICWEVHWEVTKKQEAGTDEQVHENDIENEVGEDQNYETRRILHLGKRKFAK